MAILTIPTENQRIDQPEAIQAYLAAIAIGYEQWQPNQAIAPESTAAAILEAYEPQIQTLKSRGGYVTADVIQIQPDTPNLETMLERFSQEHWHDEDVVRFTLAGHGLFHINPQTSPVVAVEVAEGDLLMIPRGTLHWFNLCGDRQIRAIRLFQDSQGWTPHYTNSGLDSQYQPLSWSLSGGIAKTELENSTPVGHL
jgi:1,2-dihydroxy-3-keto-5-methylthiopentene dioxygenase